MGTDPPGDAQERLGLRPHSAWTDFLRARLRTLLVCTRIFVPQSIYIYMLEIVAQVVPLLAMQDTIDKFVIMFVDNEPARHALAKGFGKDDSINCLLQHAWRRIEDLSLRPAWQRVTSSANVSDAVSRGDLRHARAEGWTEVQLDWDALFEELLKGSEAFRASGVL